MMTKTDYLDVLREYYFIDTMMQIERRRELYRWLPMPEPKDWACGYCNSLHPEKISRCDSCGAPKR